MNETLSKDDVVIQEIVSGARVLFEKFGLTKTTMEEIAREIGKGKSSLYYYFSSKYEIFEAVVNQEIDELFKLEYKAIRKASSAKEKLKAYSKVRLCKIASLANLCQVIKNDLRETMDVVLKIRKRHEITQINIIKSIITEGVRSGEFRMFDDKDIELLAFLFTSIFTGISIPHCTEYPVPDIAQRVDVIVDVIVDGIGR